MKSILIIGTGSIGERHLRCFQATGRCTVVACEANESLRERMRTTYGCVVYASLEEALDGGAYDAAVVCTPAHTHIPISLQCVQAGLDVLIEKPLSVSLDGLEELAAAVASHQSVVRVAYVHRSISAILAAREALLGGVTGEVRHVVMVAGQNFPRARPAYASTYYTNRAHGGGCIQDALTHTMHAVEWLVAPIERVYCDASHEVLAGVEVEDTVNLTARLRGGAAASFAMNQFQAPDEVTFTFHGPKGSVRAELHNQRVGAMALGEKEWTWTAMPVEERDVMFVRQAEAFLDAMDGQPDNLSTLSEGIQTLRVNLAALESADTRREVLINSPVYA